MNSIFNSIFLFYLLVIVLAISIVFTIGETIIDQLKVEMPVDVSAYESVYDFVPNLKVVLIGAVNFLITIIIMVSFVSSAIERHDITSYMFNFMGAIVVSSILMFTYSTVITVLMSSTGGYISYDFIPDWFANNIQGILMFNIIAGLCSFIFVQRGN